MKRAPEDVFHYIKISRDETLRKIVNVHFPNIKKTFRIHILFLLQNTIFQKKLSTSEALDWIKYISA